MNSLSKDLEIARAAMNALPQATAIVNTNGIIIEANHRWKELNDTLGPRDPGAAALGENYLECWKNQSEHQDAYQILQEAFDSAIHDRSSPDRHELIYKVPSETGERSFRLEIFPIRTTPSHALLMRQDVTTNRQKQLRARTLLAVDEALSLRHNTDSMARQALSRLHSAVDADLSIIFLWEKSENVFRARQVVGGTDEDRTRLQESAIERDLQFGDLMKREEGLICHDPSAQDFLPESIWKPHQILQFMSAPLQTDSLIMGVLILGRRTESPPLEDHHLRLCRAVGRRLAYGLENANLVKALADASRLKSEFVATMSHELRTPLHVVLGYADLLRDEAFGSLNDQQKDSLSRIERSGTALLELINETLNLSQLDAGEMQLSLDEIDLTVLFERIAAEGAVPHDTRGVAYETNISSTLPPIVSDRGKIEVIVRNLLSNAFKFTTEGFVRLTAQETSAGICLSVEDSGEGMSPETLAVAFEPFRQGADPLTRKVGGAGLGLHLVERYTELLGGTVSVDSNLGEGSTFVVNLPRRSLTIAAGGS